MDEASRGLRPRKAARVVWMPHAASLLLAACGSGQAEATATDVGSSSSGGGSPALTGTDEPPGPETIPSEGSSGMTTSEGSSASTDDVDSGPTLRLDAAPLPDAPGVERGCHAIDFLFVIDDSGSMAEYQANLIANFPAFIDGIESTLDEVDSVHVGVVTTDAYDFNMPGCDRFGGLVVWTQMGGMCGPYAAGHNYMTEEDDLANAFACAANVGTDGSGAEQPMNAIEYAIDDALPNHPAACNAGFLRDDALLVVIVITDEADDSVGTPSSWYETVIAAKYGRAENAAVVAFLNYDALESEPPSPCPGFGPPYEDVPTFVRMFGDNGFLGGICQPDYGPTFADVVSIIDGACENFFPTAG